MILRVILIIELMLATSALFLSWVPVHAGDGQSDQGTTSSVTVDGNVKVDVVASGPSELAVKATGPSKVWVCTGNECRLEVQAERPAVVNINEDCGQAKNSFKPQSGLEIIPGVLRIEGLPVFRQDNEAGRLVVFLLGTRYEL
jgi:hypothetical protein